MGLTYFKRYRMEIDLPGRDLSWPQVPLGYRLLPWVPSLLEAHAEVKYLSFRDEIDANVFPCFGELAGCQRLMNDISRKPGFLPDTTWLAVYTTDDGRQQEYCGTVQGIRDRFGMGGIQNLGITPGHRSRGLGTVLLMRALRGFRMAGLNRVYLEVTADNEGAIRLYNRLGFYVVKTVYKAAEVASYS
jgi:ribosomal protein S18 acetylase RimI-like enzyme